MIQTEIYVKSTIDGTMQPSLLYASPNKNRPLLVGLHSWSYDRFNQVDYMLPYAEKYDFNLLLPEFRGPNLSTNPDCTKACGSIYAKQDIIDATDYAVKECEADNSSVFLLGGSGGGHMALLIAGYKPERYSVIAAFAGITDLNLWKDEDYHYTEHILACCSNSLEEMMKRSPVSYVDTIKNANLKIFHGKTDEIVPVNHAKRLYDMINEKYPDCRVYLDIFDGKHDMDLEAAMYWILSQYKGNTKNEITS